MESLPVIFRKHYDRDLREWYVTAFFPTLPWAGRGDMTCYQHVGQHGAAAVSYFNGGKPAKPAEYADLLAELKGIYEEGEEPCRLVVYKRDQPAFREARNAA